MNQETFVTLMAAVWGVDASAVSVAPELVRSYFSQEKLALQLVREGKSIDASLGNVLVKEEKRKMLEEKRKMP